MATSSVIHIGAEFARFGEPLLAAGRDDDVIALLAEEELIRSRITGSSSITRMVAEATAGLGMARGRSSAGGAGRSAHYLERQPHGEHRTLAGLAFPR